MKKSYLFLFFVTLFGVSVHSQSCPPTGFSDSASLYFFYDSGTSLCGDRPVTIMVGASEFTLVDCGDAYSVYDLTSGAPLANSNMFTADFGYATCEYTNGNLTNEVLSTVDFEKLDSSIIKVYPNPVVSGNNLFVDFGKTKVSVKLSVHTVTGKQVLSNTVSNFNKGIVNVSTLPNGIYLIKIASDTKTVTRKFVVMK